MHWPSDTLLVSNVACGAKRVAHPWSMVSVFFFLLFYADLFLKYGLCSKKHLHFFKHSSTFFF
jgi:hypothetical protein